MLVLLTDVDDYGAYDQATGNICGFGCGTPPTDLDGMITTLVEDVKGGAMEGLAAVVVAGDPSIDGGVNLCAQPSTCCSLPGLECEVFRADRLWAFTDALGNNGYAANLCTTSPPLAVETALTDSIEIACQEFEPEG